MKRLGMFFYYLLALLEPVHATCIWSVPLAWRLAGIAAQHHVAIR